MGLLDLEGWKFTERTIEDGVDIRGGAPLEQVTVCDLCEEPDQLDKHGRRTIDYLDAPAYGKQTKLRASLQRFRCKACKGTFLHRPEGVRDDPRMTTRVFAYIQDNGMRETFAAVAKRVGCDEKTVRSVVSGPIQAITEGYVPTVPEYMGMDETMLCGDYAFMVTDVKKRLPVDILPTRKSESIIKWLKDNQAHRKVYCVTTDMYQPYKNIVKATMPGVPIVIDKFHVVRQADLAVETIRRNVAKGKDKEVGRAWKRQSVLLRLRRDKVTGRGLFDLDTWLDNEPQLAVAYWLKERFYDIYAASDRQTAGEMLDAWLASVPAELARTPRKDFKMITTSAKNWREELLNYFDHPVTNGYTESLNGHTKRMNRAGFGYSFPVLRARMLWPIVYDTRQEWLRLERPSHPPLVEPVTWAPDDVLTPNFTAEQLYEMRRAIHKDNGGRCQLCHSHFPLSELTMPSDYPVLQCWPCFEEHHHYHCQT